MSNPRGKALYALVVQLDAAAVPVVVNAYRSIDGGLSNWQNLGPVPFNWYPITQELEVISTFDWDCLRRRSIIYWRSGNLYGASFWGIHEWRKRDDDSWSISPEPPGSQNYTIVFEIADIMAVAPPNEEFTLLAMCGPGNPQGVWPRVTQITPV